MLGQKEICENLKISEAEYWQIADNWKHYSWAIGDETNQKVQTVIMCDYTYQDEDSGKITTEYLLVNITKHQVEYRISAMDDDSWDAFIDMIEGLANVDINLVPINNTPNILSTDYITDHDPTFAW